MCRLSTLPAHPTGVYESYANGDKIAYSYNNEGNLTSQTKNSKSAPYVTYEYNSDGESTWYFQYDTNGTPLGFVLNGTQYFYITNQMGDILAITDAEGNIVGNYEYDAWGKVLTADTDIAKQNPLRYRGYYYDNETGLYYLQSRYYSPDLCRFISPDDFDYINNSSTLYLNAYAYCYNNAVSLSDAEGTTPQLAMNVADISAFVKHIGAKAKETAKESLEKAKALLNKTVEKLKEMWAKLEEKRSKTLEDLKYFIKYPDVVINNTLSKLLNKEVKICFRLVELIRKAVEKAELTKAEKSSSDDNSNSSSKAKAKAKSKNDDSNNIVNAILQGLIAAIELDWINEILKGIGSSLDQLAKISFEGTKQVSLAIIAFMNTVYTYVTNSFSLDTLSNFGSSIIDRGVDMAEESGSKLIDAKGLGTGFGLFTSILAFLAGIDSAGSGKTFSKSEDIVMNAVNAAIGIACLFINGPFAPIAGFVIPFISSITIDVVALRIKGLIFEI